MKLYRSIDEVRIHGDPGRLNEVVSSVDKHIFELSNSTKELTTKIKSYFETNKGDQYRKIGEVATALSKKLEEQSIEMNECQKQISKFQSILRSYEEQHSNDFAVKKHNVEAVKVNLETKDTYFSENVMRSLYNSLVSYSENTKKTLTKLCNEKNDARSFWFDKQYNVFSKFIDDTVQIVKKALQIFDAYTAHLKGLIDKVVQG